MPQHIRKGDMVMITAGKDANASNPTGKVLRVLPKLGKVVVEGKNLARRHVKPSQKYPQGGVIEKEMPIDLSNVMPVVDGKPTRVRFETQADGSKIRVAVKTGKAIGDPLRKARA